ncbi:MAG: histone deacetylase [Candidatus Bathyarchaeota archaeon]|nr:histone deacetylase [Candidatus Bathyarchaeota archaeon]MDH5787394.1 histone deacetylase [Candidatus Bathyarchaeota archaeon]
MGKTAVIFSPLYYRHRTGRNHPESARRLRAIVEELKKDKISGNGKWQFIHPNKAPATYVQLVHGLEYIKLVEAVCKSGGGLLDLGDTMTSRESFEVALYAVGGALKAVDLVMEKKFENAFAVVRPPGHHAGRFRACGFCIFNNVAIAAEYLIRKFKLGKIAILDIDAHHGNGTQEVFYKTNKVLYVSIHEDPRSFPGTGFIDEIGEGEGLGYNINVPLPFGTTDQIFLRALDEIVLPAVREYEPQFVLVSAGLDGHYTDPVGNLSLSALCYEKAFETIMKLTSDTCEGKLVAVLEGGYSLNFVGKIATAAIAEISGANYALNDKVLTASKGVRLQGEKAIEKVKKVLRSFEHTA